MSDKLFSLLFPQIQSSPEKLNELANSHEFKRYIAAKDNWVKKEIESVIKLEYELDKIPSLQSLRKYKLELQAELRQAVNPRRCMFITVNPSKNVDLTTFMQVLHKYCSRAMFSRTLYCLEQRGTIDSDDLGKGFHAHILCCRASGYPPNKIKKNTFNTFKNLVGSEASIDYGGRYCVVPNRESYIVGTKKDSAKHAKQNGDKIWREKNGIKPYYGKLFSE